MPVFQRDTKIIRMQCSSKVQILKPQNTKVIADSR